MPFPKVGGALWGWTKQTTLMALNKKVVDHELQETPTAVFSFAGLLVPTPGRRVDAKPEGQRAWKWRTLFTKQELQLDGIVQDPKSGTQYRLMTLEDWSDAGFRSYDMVQWPTGPES
jgi:hypothetical protein